MNPKFSAVASGFRWSLSFGSNGKASLTGNLVFTLDGVCVYSSKKLTGFNTKEGATYAVVRGALKTKSKCGKLGVVMELTASAYGEGLVHSALF